MPGTPAAVRRTSTVVVLALLAVVATLLPSPQARAQEVGVGSRVGFSNGGGFAWQSDANLTRELDLMASTGAKWVRLDFDWSGVEGTRGRYSWSNLDRVVGAIQARGMKVLALPAYTPSWARPAGTTSHHPPTDPAHFAAFVGAAAARYAPQGVTVWEIWNEPNIPNFWEPKPDVAGYVTLLRAASAAIRAAAPGTTIVTGGLSPASDSADGRYVDPRTFISKMYALGARSSFDALGVHPYSFPALPSDVRTASWNTFQKLTTMRETMVANGDSGKKIWLTETGAPTGTSAQAVTEQRQAEIITDTIRATEGLAWAGPVFLYAARDAGSDLTDREDNFGLIRRDFSGKPAWTALRTALAPKTVATAPAPAPTVAAPAPAPSPSSAPAPATAPTVATASPTPVAAVTAGPASALTGAEAAGAFVGPVAALPAAPTGVTAAAQTVGIAVRWNGVVGATGYIVERSATAPGTAGRSWSRIGSTDGAGRTVSDRNAVSRTRYYYRVRATSSLGIGAASAEATAIAGGLLRTRSLTGTTQVRAGIGPISRLRLR